MTTDAEIEAIATALCNVEWKGNKFPGLSDMDREYWYASARAAILALDSHRTQNGLVCVKQSEIDECSRMALETFDTIHEIAKSWGRDLPVPPAIQALRAAHEKE